ncbi:DNA recombination protein RmuC [Candidatus Omnitrophus magneticus]|uniref:DNA recombination protein RmuC n=1 Tax=Candidatus Omnitrophus magneticus TaxID=1609969 RepID=A0A0F0CLX8_9BACT|nr:DNA recombination protein RmuC [Candidatus Omnitrophus magneticus]
MIIILFFVFGLFLLGAFCFYKITKMSAELKLTESKLKEAKDNLVARDEIISGLRLKSELLTKNNAILETKLEESSKRLEEEKSFLEQAKEKFRDMFQALSGEALKSNNKTFMELAKEPLDSILKQAKLDMEKREDSIKNIVKPLEETLKKYETALAEIEKSRAAAYGSLDNHLKIMTIAQESLAKETGNLVSALRRPEVRGRWGEMTLKRVVELAGMVEHCDYDEQVSSSNDDGKIRPDMIIRLPNERIIVIDSKISLDAYLDALNTIDATVKNNSLDRHASQMRRHMKDLSNKNYWKDFEKTPEFVIMFVPGESFLSAALEKDTSLIEDGMNNRVIISTPTTLIALLHAVSYGWRQEEMAKNAREISELGKDLIERFNPFMEHLNKTGKCLADSVKAFNNMSGSLEKRVLVSIRKFQELGISQATILPELKEIEELPIKTDEN